MKKLIVIGITLSFLLGLAPWQHQHIADAKAAPMFGTFTVTSTADSGGGSLRQAILDANGAAGPDTINFDTAAVFATTGGQPGH